ncbi:hypothetical protein F2Q68_00007362 [Brassica cretica]|uniref:Uncharacterized protein n=1 Tax=Brassica cretica TaxID=69181 RepID=A0A8S9KNS9_BRACR|nr:hypothetical protein F2Q68_00007362 [Brassica cretica]
MMLDLQSSGSHCIDGNWRERSASSSFTAWGARKARRAFSAARFESLMGNLIEKKQDNGLAKENVFEKETFFVGWK